MSERVVLGVGCTSSATVDECLESISRVVRADWTVVAIATIEGKGALIESVAEALGVASTTWTADELDRVGVPHPSDFVREVTGSVSVAEAAALLAGDGGPLLAGKARFGTVTVAVGRAVDQPPAQPGRHSSVSVK